MMTRQLHSDGPLRLRSSRALDAALAVVSSSGDPQFADLAIRQINRLLPIGWWTVYRLRNGVCPTWHLGASTRSYEVIARAWARYCDGLWKEDRTFRDARAEMAHAPAVMAHLHAREVDGPHRTQIYSAFDLTERVSFVRAQADGSSLCVNLYRGQDMGDFGANELDDLACVGDLLLRAVEVHLQCLARSERHSPLDLLPRREREVCDRMLRGMTFDGIAVDLDLSANTVKTYRDRAFDRLGIHHRSELFALVLQVHVGRHAMADVQLASQGSPGPPRR